jgi:hypothetical protein
MEVTSRVSVQKLIIASNKAEVLADTFYSALVELKNVCKDIAETTRDDYYQNRLEVLTKMVHCFYQESQYIGDIYSSSRFDESQGIEFYKPKETQKEPKKDGTEIDYDDIPF